MTKQEAHSRGMFVFFLVAVLSRSRALEVLLRVAALLVVRSIFTFVFLLILLNLTSTDSLNTSTFGRIHRGRGGVHVRKRR